MVNKTSNVHSPRNGFTVVEILIVVVVIAILAAVTIVSYSAVKKRSLEETAKTDLIGSGSGFTAEQANNSTRMNPKNSKYLSSETASTTISYAYGNTKSYCMVARSKQDSSIVFHQFTGDQNNSTVNAGDCPTPDYSTSYRCIISKVYSVFILKNNSPNTVYIKTTHTVSAEQQQTNDVAPGDLRSGTANLRTSVVQRGIIEFSVFNSATNQLVDTYYQASPAMSC